MNQFFASVFTHEDLTDVPSLDIDFGGEPLEDIVFTQHEVTRKLKDLDPGKTAGPDNLHPALLKELASDISEVVTEIFCKSLDEGKLPRMWKQGNISPIFKKGNKHDPGNYRPISLTSVLSKVMETFVRDAVREHLLKNDLISSQQHGFIPGRSTSSQLLECFDEWSLMIEEGSSVDVIYLDFKKAFDAVPHKRLINKLYAYGIRGVLSKVMETFVRDAVREHLLKNDLISSQQHGFIPGRSTSSQLLECFDEWSLMIEEGSSVDVIYLDFKKAFDAVPHKRLINKLYAYGIRGKVLAWIDAFLTQRAQRVVINGEASDWAEVTSGIPQGSVLGPLCFLIYINDLPGSVQNSIKLYADDAKLYGQVDSQEQSAALQRDLEAIQDWTKRWQLPLNTQKCKVLHLGSRNQARQYILEGNVVQETDAEKDLGVIVDKTMKFHEQNASSVKKANKLLGIIKKSFDFLDETNVNLLYKVMIRPVLEYCNIAWGPHYKMDQKKIEQVQRRATRLVPSLRHLPYQERLEKLGMPSLSYRRRRGDMIAVFKIMTGRASGIQFFTAEKMQGRTRGHQLKLKKFHAKKDVRRQYFSHRVINDWNNLPSSVINVGTVSAFKRALDQQWAGIKYQLD